MNSMEIKFWLTRLLDLSCWRCSLYLFVVLLTAVHSIPSHAVATAKLDRNPIRMGESVRMIVSVDQDRSGENIDYSELQKSFEVLGTSNSTQINITNGQQAVSQKWLIDLAPKREGSVLIPSLRIGRDITQPLHLTVLPARVGKASSNPDFFVEVEAVPTQPYVQEQILFTVRLFHATNVVDGSLSEPIADNLVIEKLGDDSGYETRRNGKAYRVVQRRYAIFGQRSGMIVIPPIRFLGQVRDLSRSNSMFNRFVGRGRRIQSSSNATTLRIRPKPAQFSGSHWLPASQLVLSELWPQGIPKFRVGEPVTRILKIRAVGLSNVQLPELNTPELSALKVYPEPARLESFVDDSGVIGEREQSMAIVPNQPGNILLPELKVVWWDVKNDVQQEAIISAKQYSVLPANGAANKSRGSGVAKNAPDSPPNQVAIGTLANAGTSSIFWQGLTILLAVLWLATLGFWWRQRVADSATTQPEMVPEEFSKAKKVLKEACFANDARLAYRALMRLADQKWPENPPQGIRHIALRCHDRGLMVEIDRLDRSLYSKNSITWEGRRLWENCEKFFKQSDTGKKNDKNPLVPLHLHQN